MANMLEMKACGVGGDIGRSIGNYWRSGGNIGSWCRDVYRCSTIGH